MQRIADFVAHVIIAFRNELVLESIAIQQSEYLLICQFSMHNEFFNAQYVQCNV